MGHKKRADFTSRALNGLTLGAVGSLFGRSGAALGFGVGALGNVGPFEGKRGGALKAGMRCRVRGGGPKKWISGALQKTVPGRFSGKANRSGMSTSKFACHVLSHKDSYDVQTRREAQMFVNMNKSRRCGISGGHSKLRHYELSRGQKYHFTAREVMNGLDDQRAPLKIYNATYMYHTDRNFLKFIDNSGRIFYIDDDENMWFKPV